VIHARPVTEREKRRYHRRRVRWQRAKNRKPRTENGEDDKLIIVRLENVLLERCNALAKKKGNSRDALIVRGLKALLAAEGQI
jgi:hypothetical protein